MTNLRKQFNRLKKKSKKSQKNNLSKINLSLFDDPDRKNSIPDPINDFLRIKKISTRDMIRFYVTEMTGISEEEFNEHFLKNRMKSDREEMKEAVMEAVKFKLKCELEDDSLIKN